MCEALNPFTRLLFKHSHTHIGDIATSQPSCGLSPSLVCQGGPSLSLQREQLEELYSAHSESMSVLLEEDGAHTTEDGFPQGPANFTLLWSLFLTVSPSSYNVYNTALVSVSPSSYHLSNTVLCLRTGHNLT